VTVTSQQILELLLLVYCYAVIVIYFVEKKRNKNNVACGGTIQLLFKTAFLVELGLDLLFPEGK